MKIRVTLEAILVGILLFAQTIMLICKVVGLLHISWLTTLFPIFLILGLVAVYIVLLLIILIMTKVNTIALNKSKELEQRFNIESKRK